MAKETMKPAAKRAIFVREYLIDRNATRAAIAAGYSQKSAYSTGSRMLKNAKVQDELRKLHKASCDRLDITLDAVNQELAKLAFIDAGQFLTIDAAGNARLDLKKISEPSEADDDTSARKPIPRYSAAIQEITEKSWMEGRGPDARRMTEVKLKLTGHKHAALESLRKYLTGDDDSQMTPEQKKQRLNYLLQNAGYIPKKEHVN